MSFADRRIAAKPSLWGLLPAVIAAGTVVLAGGIFILIEFQTSPIEVVVTDSSAFSSIWFSVFVAASSTSISALLGTLLALWIWKQNHWSLSSLYILPLILPHIVAAFFTLVFFSQSGIISSLANAIGLTDSPSDFPVLVFDNSGVGIIIAYLYKETAFISLMVLQVLRKIDPRQIQTSRMLGASGVRRFLTVVFPEIARALGVASIIVFIYSFASFDIPFLVGSASRPMVAVEAYRLFFEGSLDQRPMALALLSRIWLVSLGFLSLFFLLYQKLRSNVIPGRAQH